MTTSHEQSDALSCVLMAGLTVLAFELGQHVPVVSFPAMIAFAWAIHRLVATATVRQAFYGGMTIGTFIATCELAFFAGIFGAAAIILWLIIGVWHAAALSLMTCLWKRVGRWAVAGSPAIWMAFEYFRSELYHLRFSWITPGLALVDGSWNSMMGLGQFGIGAGLIALGGLLYVQPRWGAIVVILSGASVFMPLADSSSDGNPIRIAGIQLEHVTQSEVLAGLDQLRAEYPDADLLVLSEYTFSGPVPHPVRNWCDVHNKYLIVGGVEYINDSEFQNTAFVVGPAGTVEHKQGKSVPIQFFRDGLPAADQRCWNSPFGRIAIPTCYDLSYTRVMDRFADQDAELIINPTMDLRSWGKAQHYLHSRVPVARATEYGVPVARLASSGVSVFCDGTGRQLAEGGYPGQGAMVMADFSIANAAKLPVDRYLAPGALTATLLISLALFIDQIKKPFVNDSPKRIRMDNGTERAKRRAS